MNKNSRPQAERKRARQADKEESRDHKQKQNVLQHVRAEEIAIRQRVYRREKREDENHQCGKEPDETLADAKDNEISTQSDAGSDKNSRIPRPGGE
jgi:hypothetical protein